MLDKTLVSVNLPKLFLKTETFFIFLFGRKFVFLCFASNCPCIRYFSRVHAKYQQKLGPIDL